MLLLTRKREEIFEPIDFMGVRNHSPQSPQQSPHMKN